MSRQVERHLKSLSGGIAVTMGSRGMDRESFKDEVNRVIAGVRSDIRTAISRVDGFLYTVRVDIKIRYKKAKKAVKQAWHEVWR
jgi:hypothetical protein